MSSNRIKFLLQKYNVVDDAEVFDESTVREEIRFFESEDMPGSVVITTDNKTHIRQNIFDLISKADPTNKKVYTQWILNRFLSILKKDVVEANRFVTEDMGVMYDSLKKYDNLKKTKNFKDLSKYNFSITHIDDPSDILQYSTHYELFDALFPFGEKNYFGLFAQFKLYHDLKEAKIEFEDPNFIVYTPFSLRANVCLNGYTTWCTSRPDNGMYLTYQNNLTPNKKKSKLYVVVNKDTNEMFQLHFESQQIRDANNNQNIHKFVANFLNRSLGLDNYLYDQLLTYALMPNSHETYVRHAISFGYSKILLDTMKPTDTKVQISDFKLRGHIPLKKFDNLETVILSNNDITNFPTDLLYQKNLRILSLYGNNLTEIPDTIVYLKKLYVLNLVKNKLTELPETIRFLDPGNGGSLVRLSIEGNKFSKTNIEKLKKLLPNVDIG